MQNFLLWIHRRPLIGWIAVIFYAALVTFPHENVQYAVNEIAGRITHRRLYQASAGIALLMAAAFTFWLLLALRKHAGRRLILGYWILTIALIVGTWRLLTANNTELVHYPQYLPEGAALFALTLSPVESIAWVTIFGGLDESFQYAHLMRGRPVQFDFNDIYMDLLGGAAGVLLAMAAHSKIPPLLAGIRPRPWHQILKTPGIAAILSIAAIGILLISSGFVLVYERPSDSRHWLALSRDKPPAYWFVNPMFGPHKFHTLSPIEGPLLILVTLGIYAKLDRRFTPSRSSAVVFRPQSGDAAASRPPA